MHNDFTLFIRKYPNGNKVVFYYAYDDRDVRLGPWTTKCRSLTGARKYCHVLLREGRLIPSRDKMMTFGEYAVGFWDRDSPYIENQNGRADITDSYIENCRKMVVNQILPFFGKVPLDKITDKDINKWLLGFKKREVEVDNKMVIRGYKNTYANTVFGTLNVMIEEAVKRDLIKMNPCDKVQRLKNDRKKIEIITVEEVRRLFPKDWGSIWGDKETAYLANRLASLTGMRAGEILGLRGKDISDTYITVCGQYGEYGYGTTKTKETRYIPLIPEMIGLLRKLAENNGGGYVFSLNGGAVPVSRRYIYNEFHKALKRIGIGGDEIKRRGLSIHSWRHFLNTELQRLGLTIQQVQSVTGHKSDRMSEWYNHPDARAMPGIMQAQMLISGGGGEPEPKTGRGKVIPITGRGTSRLKKQA